MKRTIDTNLQLAFAISPEGVRLCPRGLCRRAGRCLPPPAAAGRKTALSLRCRAAQGVGLPAAANSRYSEAPQLGIRRGGDGGEAGGGEGGERQGEPVTGGGYGVAEIARRPAVPLR